MNAKEFLWLTIAVIVGLLVYGFLKPILAKAGITV